MRITKDGGLDITPQREHQWQIKPFTNSEDSPEDFYANSIAYFQWCVDNPLPVNNVVLTGKEAGTPFKYDKERPFTIKGLCSRLGILEEWLSDIRNSKTEDSDWYKIVSWVLYQIFVQNQEMAMIGEFNPNFTSRVLALEKDVEAPRAFKLELVGNLPTLSRSESEILEKLKIEADERGNSQREKGFDDFEVV